MVSFSSWQFQNNLNYTKKYFRGLAIRPNEGRGHEMQGCQHLAPPTADFVWETSLAIEGLYFTLPYI